MDGTFIKSASIALQRERGGGSQEKWREPKRTSAISCSGDQQRIHYQQGGQAEENGQRPNQKFLTSGRYTRRPTNESTWLRDVKSHRHFARSGHWDEKVEKCLSPNDGEFNRPLCLSADGSKKKAHWPPWETSSPVQSNRRLSAAEVSN